MAFSAGGFLRFPGGGGVVTPVFKVIFLLSVRAIRV